jgi:predicted short-subunit dehydrogenase-like oxidoreductase (DUF2520 family)
MKVVLIGAGNVAYHLGSLIRSSGHDIIQLYNHTKTKGLRLSKILGCEYTNSISSINRTADIYIIALKDDAIKPFCNELNFVPSLIVHTSGTCSLDVFPEEFDCGVLYPAQTFSANMTTPRQIPFCIEARRKKSLTIIRTLADNLGTKVHMMNSNQREKVHLAAVVVNNFTNHLFALSEEYLRSEKLSFDILRPLIMETANKVQSISPMKVQTGPAKRNDKSVINEHKKLLKKHPELKRIYDILTNSIIKHSDKP